MFHTDILFTGFYGQLNTGDDAFVEVASWGASKYWGKNRNRFLAKKDRLPKTIVTAKGYPFTLPKTYAFQAEQLLKRTNALIFAGGSTIHSKLSSDNIRMKALDLKRSGRNLKVGGIGVSVGPFKSIEDERAVEMYLKELDFLSVRDQASYDFLTSLNLPYLPVNSFDLAALLPDIYNYRKVVKDERNKSIIGVSVCPYESLRRDLDVKNENRRNEMMVKLLKELDRSSEIHFKFYIINGNSEIGDKKLTLETINQVGPKSYEIVEYNRSIQSVWSSIAECDFVISTRLHASIFACFANTPFMLNEYHRKCSDFLDNVEYAAEYRLYDANYNVNQKATQILEIISEKKYRAPGKVDEMKKRASLNFTQINL